MTTKTLPSTINTRTIERRVLSAARQILGIRGVVADFEHGHWWITDKKSGAQWDAVDAEGGRAVLGFDFELVTQGDEA